MWQKETPQLILSKALDIPVTSRFHISGVYHLIPDVGTRSVVCGAGQWRKDGGVVIRWKQSLPSAGCGGTGPVILYSFFNRREGGALGGGSIWKGGVLGGVEHYTGSRALLFFFYILSFYHGIFTIFIHFVFHSYNNIIIPMRKDRGVVIRWKQGLPSAGCGGEHSLPNTPPLPSAHPSQCFPFPGALGREKHWGGRVLDEVLN